MRITLPASLTALALVFLTGLGTVRATDWFVDASVAGPGTGTKADPFKSLTQAVNAAASNDRIFVAPGTYDQVATAEAFPLQIGATLVQNNLQIIATGGPAVTILDGLQSVNGNGILRFRLGAAGAKLCGFTVANYGGTLGAIRLGSISAGFEASNVEICHCIIRDHGGGSGIATFGASDQLKIHDNFIYNCFDNGIWCSDITCNPPGGGGAVWNNTIVNCGEGVRVQGGTWTVSNNIIALCVNNGIVDWGLAGTACTPPPPAYVLDYNCFFANATNHGNVAPAAGAVPGPNDVFADPLLTNVVTGDLHIVPGSPCRDAGNPAVPAWVASDFDGGPRLLAGPSGLLRPEIGADEITDVALQQIGAASISLGAVGFNTVGPPGDLEIKAYAFGQANVVTAAGNLLLDPLSLTIIDVVPNVIDVTGNSLLGIPTFGLPPAAIGLVVHFQALVGGPSGVRLTNALTTIVCP